MLPGLQRPVNAPRRTPIVPPPSPRWTTKVRSKRERLRPWRRTVHQQRSHHAVASWVTIHLVGGVEYDRRHCPRVTWFCAGNRTEDRVYGWRSMLGGDGLKRVEQLRKMPCARRGHKKHMKASIKDPRSQEINLTPVPTRPVVSSRINMAQNFKHLFLKTFFYHQGQLAKPISQPPLWIFLHRLFCYTHCAPLHTVTCFVFKIVASIICYLLFSQSRFSCNWSSCKRMKI